MSGSNGVHYTNATREFVNLFNCPKVMRPLKVRYFVNYHLSTRKIEKNRIALCFKPPGLG